MTKVTNKKSGKSYEKTEDQIAAIRANPLTKDRFTIEKAQATPPEIQSKPSGKQKGTTLPGADSDKSSDENQQ